MPTLLAQGLHVSTTAEPHRTVMRGVEGEGGGRVTGGSVKNYSEQHRTHRGETTEEVRGRIEEETVRKRKKKKGFSITNMQKHSRSLKNKQKINNETGA